METVQQHITTVRDAAEAYGQACTYTLAQVAEAMQFSDVLVTRLSSYFKLPRQYYERDQGPRLMIFDQSDLDTLFFIKRQIAAGKNLTDLKTLLARAPRAPQHQGKRLPDPPPDIGGQGRLFNPLPVRAMRSLDDMTQAHAQAQKPYASAPEGAGPLKRTPEEIANCNAVHDPGRGRRKTEYTDDTPYVEYDQTDAMNRRLADHTFSEYRRQNRQEGARPLKDLAGRMRDLDAGDELGRVRQDVTTRRRATGTTGATGVRGAMGAMGQEVSRLEATMEAIDGLYDDELPFQHSFPVNAWISMEQRSRMWQLQQDLLARLL
ncbi:MAG: hypothetical protein KC475_11160 [Cyanobacteria bacterium HKST-UBA03]|nr:hypothetical protein [Cyanobacteria bacterium HKST-UBA03]